MTPPPNSLSIEFPYRTVAHGTETKSGNSARKMNVSSMLVMMCQHIAYQQIKNPDKFLALLRKVPTAKLF